MQCIYVKMTRFITFLSVLCLLSIAVVRAGEPWKVNLRSAEEDVNLYLDLYEESIEVPGMEMFGPMNGYMKGNIYGVWTVTSYKIISDKQASIKVSNDLGSETQKILLTRKNDSVWNMKFEGHNVVKRVKNRKLVKIPAEMTMKQLR